MARPRGKLAHSHDGVLTSDLRLIYSRLSAFIRGRLWNFDLRRWTFSNLAFVIQHLPFVTFDFGPSTLDIHSVGFPRVPRGPVCCLSFRPLRYFGDTFAFSFPLFS